MSRAQEVVLLARKSEQKAQERAATQTLDNREGQQMHQLLPFQEEKKGDMQQSKKDRAAVPHQDKGGREAGKVAVRSGSKRKKKRRRQAALVREAKADGVSVEECRLRKDIKHIEEDIKKIGADLKEYQNILNRTNELREVLLARCSSVKCEKDSLQKTPPKESESKESSSSKKRKGSLNSEKQLFGSKSKKRDRSFYKKYPRLAEEAGMSIEQYLLTHLRPRKSDIKRSGKIIVEREGLLQSFRPRKSDIKRLEEIVAQRGRLLQKKEEHLMRMQKRLEEKKEKLSLLQCESSLGRQELSEAVDDIRSADPVAVAIACSPPSPSPPPILGVSLLPEIKEQEEEEKKGDESSLRYSYSVSQTTLLPPPPPTHIPDLPLFSTFSLRLWVVGDCIPSSQELQVINQSYLFALLGMQGLGQQQPQPPMMSAGHAAIVGASHGGSHTQQYQYYQQFPVGRGGAVRMGQPQGYPPMQPSQYYGAVYHSHGQGGGVYR